MGDMAKGIKSFKAGMKDDEIEDDGRSRPAGRVENSTAQGSSEHSSEHHPSGHHPTGHKDPAKNS